MSNANAVQQDNVGNPENPPAFPIPDSVHPQFGTDGMTLRDYFAGQVVSGLDSRSLRGSADDIAAEAYQLADAMLVVRGKEPTR